jgi:hypothetical protein
MDGKDRTKSELPLKTKAQHAGVAGVGPGEGSGEGSSEGSVETFANKIMQPVPVCGVLTVAILLGILFIIASKK